MGPCGLRPVAKLVSVPEYEVAIRAAMREMVAYQQKGLNHMAVFCLQKVKGLLRSKNLLEDK